jgi:hypothetical protein
MSQGLVERDTESRLLILAALAGEQILFLGPPGTAKSALARRLHACIEGSNYFERLLTRFSVPEELFGPLSMLALERDLYLRNTDGYLPAVRLSPFTSPPWLNRLKRRLFQRCCLGRLEPWFGWCCAIGRTPALMMLCKAERARHIEADEAIRPTGSARLVK